MSDVTRLLQAIDQGDPRAANQLFPLVYQELRRLARRKLAREQPGHTLDATALVHEAYLRLIATPDDQPNEEAKWDGRGHFFAAAAEAMRRILVENARRKRRLKHGGGRQRQPLDEAQLPGKLPSDDILLVDEALRALEENDAQTASLVKMHFFAGLPLAEAAHVLGISERTAYRDWAYARAWLARFVRKAQGSADEL